MAKAKQIVPAKEDYTVQSNQISRAAYSMPVMQRRLLYLFMAQSRPGDDGFEPMEMSVGDIVRALGLNDSSRRYEEIRVATKGVMEQVLDLDTEDGWVMFNWIHTARHIKSRDVVQIRFHDGLAPYVLQLKDSFSIISIADISKLQSRHSLRIFELIMANKGLAGKSGNKPGHWFTDLEFSHLRTLLRIGPHEYKRTGDFRTWVIDKPVKEINNADLGIRLTCDYDHFRRGRRLIGVRLECKMTSRNEPRDISPATLDQKREDEILALNQDLYDLLLAKEPDDLFGGDIARRGNAYKELLKHSDLILPGSKSNTI